MNYQLINKLIENSTEYLSDHDLGRNRIPNFRKHEFAELLIKSCADEIQSYVDHRIPASEYHDRLLNHFGIKNALD